MAQKTRAGTAVDLVTVGFAGYSLIRVIQQVRNRATHPNMADPGRRYLMWLPWVLGAVVLLVVVGAVALFATADPVLATIATVIGALVWMAVGLVIALWLWLTAEGQRRTQKYVICEAHYAHAPRQIRSAMRRIYALARSVRTGHANQSEIFGDLGLQQLVYTAAQRAIVASEVASSVRDLRPDAMAADRALIDDANDKIRVIGEELSGVEATLKRASGAADTLSQRIPRPQQPLQDPAAERLRAVAERRAEAVAAKDGRRDRARKRLEDATARAEETPDFGHVDVEERINAVAAGYEEAEQISEKILRGPRLPSDTTEGESNSATDQTGGSIRDGFFRAARFTAGKAAKVTADGARLGKDKLKERSRPQ